MPQLTEIEVLTYYSSVVCGLLQPGSSSLISVPKVGSRQDVVEDINTESPQNMLDYNVTKKEKKRKGKKDNHDATPAVEPSVKPLDAVIAVAKPKDKEEQSKKKKTKKALDAGRPIAEDLEQNIPAPDDRKGEKQRKGLPQNATTSGQTEPAQTSAHQAPPQLQSTGVMLSTNASEGNKKSTKTKKLDSAAAVSEVPHKKTSKRVDKEGTEGQTPAKVKPRKSEGKEKDVAAPIRDAESAAIETGNGKEPAKAKPRKSKSKDHIATARIPAAIINSGASNVPSSSSKPSKPSKSKSKSKPSKSATTAPIPESPASPKSITPPRSTTPPRSFSRAPSTPISEEDVLRHLYTHLSSSSGPSVASPPTLSTSEVRKRRRESMVETPLRHKVLSRPMESLGKKRRMSAANEYIDAHEEGEQMMEEVDMLASPAVSTAIAAEKKEKKDKKKKKDKMSAPLAESSSNPSLAPISDESTGLPNFSELRKKDKKKKKEKKEEKQKEEKGKQEREKIEAKEKGKGKEHGKERKRKSEAFQAEISSPAVAPAVIPVPATASAPASAPALVSSLSTPTPKPKIPLASSSKKKRRLTEIPIPRLSPSVKSSAAATTAESPTSSKKTKLSQGRIPLGTSPDAAKMHMYASMGIVTPSPGSKGSSKKEKKIGKKGPKWITETPRM
ncbi:hypothetical protein I315_03920 [Cryptococcus gattii Ru294]|nr:hypothetical protein I315_03920 [Cryptococcus gattii Ru294]